MKTKPKPKVVALYRVSALSQVADKRSGIAAQKAAVERAVFHHDLDVISEIELVGVSGTNAVNSPEFCDMLRKISSREIDGAVVSTLDRLCSYTLESMSVLDRFVTAKALIYTGDEVLDLTTNGDRITVFIKLAFHGYDRSNFAKRSAFARAKNRTIKDSKSADAE